MPCNARINNNSQLYKIPQSLVGPSTKGSTQIQELVPTRDCTQTLNDTGIQIHTSTHTHNRVSFQSPTHIPMYRDHKRSERQVILGRLEYKMETMDVVSRLVRTQIQSI